MFSFNKTASNLVLSGKTFPVKETIKTLGGTWDSERYSWFFPLASDEKDILKKLEYAAKLIRDAKIAAKDAAKDATLRMPSHWSCCSEAVVIDAKRGFTDCKIHAIGDNSFRVRGAIFTGD